MTQTRSLFARGWYSGATTPVPRVTSTATPTPAPQFEYTLPRINPITGQEMPTETRYPWQSYFPNFGTNWVQQTGGGYPAQQGAYLGMAGQYPMPQQGMAPGAYGPVVAGSPPWSPYYRPLLPLAPSYYKEGAAKPGAGGPAKPKYKAPPKYLDPKYRQWYADFQKAHGGQTPEEYYKATGAQGQETNQGWEWMSPLEQAIADLEWSKGWEDTYGPNRPLTQRDWELHWYETHGGYPMSDAERRAAKKQRREEWKKENKPKPTPTPAWNPSPVYWGTV